MKSLYLMKEDIWYGNIKLDFQFQNLVLNWSICRLNDLVLDQTNFNLPRSSGFFLLGFDFPSNNLIVLFGCPGKCGFTQFQASIMGQQFNYWIPKKAIF